MSVVIQSSLLVVVSACESLSHWLPLCSALIQRFVSTVAVVSTVSY